MATTGPGAVPTRPPWRRWLLAAVPWVAAGVLVVIGLAASTPDLTPSPAADAASDPPDEVETPVRAASGAGPAASGTRTPLAPALELAVLAAARRTLGTAGLADDGPAADRWPLDLELTALTDVGNGIAVAVVHGLVIEEQATGWDAPQPRAVAVPVRTAPVAAVLGAAWPLATPAVGIDRARGQPVPEADPQVADVLTALGWGVDRLDVVEVVAERFLRVRVHGTPPDDARSATHEIWLDDGPDGAAPLAPPVADRTTPGPTTPQTPPPQTPPPETPPEEMP